jgi:hypothetical protein
MTVFTPTCISVHNDEQQAVRNECVSHVVEPTTAQGRVASWTRAYLHSGLNLMGDDREVGKLHQWLRYAEGERTKARAIAADCTSGSAAEKRSRVAIVSTVERGVTVVGYSVARSMRMRNPYPLYA